MIALLLLLGCGAGTAPKVIREQASSFRVDCLGMVPILAPGLGLQWGTPAIMQSEAGVTEGRRCLTFLSSANVLEWDPGPHEAVAGFSVRANGRLWHAMAGVMYDVEQSVGDFYLRGTYSGPFSDGETEIWGTGYFDLCDNTQRLDCPYQVENATVYPFETSSRILTAWGEATLCRAVIDRDTGALQVEMQAGVWNGNNLTQLYRSSCPTREDSDPEWYGNRLTFRAGGVTGPGRYGPWKVTDFGGTQLPSLSWDAPPIFMGSSIRLAMSEANLMCADVQGPFQLRTLDWTDADSAVGVNSTCSFEVVDGTPGWVEIDCSEVRHDRLPPTEVPCQNDDYGCQPDCDLSSGTCGWPFFWTGACDVVYRGTP